MSAERFEFGVSEGGERVSVRSERSSQDADLASHLDQLFDVLFGALSAHRMDIELFQALLQPLERRRVGAEHPLEQRGEEGGPVQHACVPGARDAFGELVQNRHGPVVGGDHPVLADHAFKRDHVVFLVILLARGIGGEVEVAAEVLEDRPAAVGGGEPGARRVVQPERVSHLAAVWVGSSVDIDPQQLRPLQPARPLFQALETLHLVPVEEDGVAQTEVLLLMDDVLPPAGSR